MEILIDQVRALLIQSDDSKQKHEIYNQFINECKANNLSEQDFYTKVLKVAHKSIDWDYIEAEKNKKELERIQKEDKEKAVEKELEEIKNQIKFAPQFIDRLIKSAFDDNFVEKEELIRIFERADYLEQDSYKLAEKISSQLDERKFKAYPSADFTKPSLRETLCSTDWHSHDRFAKLITPPPEPLPWKMIITALSLLSIVIFFAGYLFWFKDYYAYRNAVPMYSIAPANDLALRSDPDKDGNFIRNLNFGEEFLTIKELDGWMFGKASDEGWVNKTLLINKKQHLLIKCFLNTSDAEKSIASSRCIKALLNFFSNPIISDKYNNQVKNVCFKSDSTTDWIVEAAPYKVKPNNVLYPQIVNPKGKGTDFLVIIRNTLSKERRALFFTFDNISNKEYLLLNEGNQPEGTIDTIYKNNNEYKVRYN